MPQRKSRHWVAWAGVALVCASFAVLNTLGWYPASRASGSYGPGWKQAVVWELIRWELWVPLSGLILLWVRRFPARGEGVLRETLRDVGAGLLFPVLHSVLLVGIYFVFVGGHLGAFLHYRFFVLVTDFLAAMIVTGLVLGLARARDYHRQLREEELRASRLEAQLAEARLHALQMQLHPHFLFNTLNAISSLQVQQPETAQRMLVRLSDFLRLTLEEPAQQISLRREMDFVTRYLEIERIRFPEKLSVHLDLAPETLNAVVPNLLLQPIVENAVRHGIAAQVEPGRIGIRSARRNGYLHLEVRDTGRGLARRAGAGDVSTNQPAVEAASGIGLANIRARLEALYGKSFRLSLDDAEGGGVSARIEIPFEEAPGA